MKSYLLDIDGTLLEGSQPLPGALDFLKQLLRSNENFLLATNSIQPVSRQIQRFASLGVPLEPHLFYSPLRSINQWIQGQGLDRVMVVGSQVHRDQIQAKHTMVDPQLVVLLDFEKENIAYQELQNILDVLETGCPIVSASGSPFYRKDGKKQIDTGAFVRLLEAVTNQTIPILGKPSIHYYQNAATILQAKADEIIAIGDDWSTDIKGAKACGFGSILVKTGKYQSGDERRETPDRVLVSLEELL